MGQTSSIPLETQLPQRLRDSLLQFRSLPQISFAGWWTSVALPILESWGENILILLKKQLLILKPYEVGDTDLNFCFQKWSRLPVLASGNTPSC